MRGKMRSRRRTKVAKDVAAKASRRRGDERHADCATLRIQRDKHSVAAARGDDDAEAPKHVGRERTWGEGDRLSVGHGASNASRLAPLTRQRLDGSADA